MRTMHYRLAALSVCAALLLSACALTRSPPSFSNPVPQPPAPSGSAQPAPGTPAAPAESVPVPSPEKPYTPPVKQFHLSAASQSLVNQAHGQAGHGDYGAAAATIERAVRIEPDNPLLWTELGRIYIAQDNPAQAEAMGRKALALATGDAAAQSSAWHLIADSLRARGKNAEAADAERRAAGASTHAG
jgi:tetratricopeptide (TPR) repeat protein